MKARDIELPLLDPSNQREIIRARALVARTFEALPAYDESRELFLAALAGGSAWDAVVEPPMEFMGRVVAALLVAGVQPKTMRDAIQHAWLFDHVNMRRHFAAERLALRGVFRDAEFRLPADMPDAFVVWRGTGDVNKATAEKGESWTPSRSVGCLFAGCRMFVKRDHKNPLLLRRMVKKSDVLFYQKQIFFDEIISDGPVCAEVDGTVADWAKVIARLKHADEMPRDEYEAMLFPGWVTP